MNAKKIIAHKDRPAYIHKTETQLSTMSEKCLMERVNHLNIILGGHEAVLVEVADLQQANKMLLAKAKKEAESKELTGLFIDEDFIKDLCHKLEKAVAETTELSDRRALLLKDNHAIHDEFKIIEGLFERIDVIKAFSEMDIPEAVYVHSSSFN